MKEMYNLLILIHYLPYLLVSWGCCDEKNRSKKSDKRNWKVAGNKMKRMKGDTYLGIQPTPHQEVKNKNRLDYLVRHVNQ